VPDDLADSLERSLQSLALLEALEVADRLPARGRGGTVVAPCMRRRHFGPAAAGGGGEL
jgi:hypothetical protein